MRSLRVNYIYPPENPHDVAEVGSFFVSHKLKLLKAYANGVLGFWGFGVLHFLICLRRSSILTY